MRLKDPEIRDFIRQHQDDDVRALGLKKPPMQDWPYPLILDQIKARQMAKRKIPRWLTHDPNIIFPSSDVLEQASSAATARYKASLVKGKTFVDLTGGAGVDSCALSEYYASGVCVEHNEDAAALIAHNMPLLTDKPIDVHHSCAEDFVEVMEPVDLVYIDPQRRTGEKKGLYQFQSCSPNVISIIKILKNKVKNIIVKASPMLDIEAGIRDLEHVKHVHVVEWRGECKELLFVLGFDDQRSVEDVPITAVTLDDEGHVQAEFTFTKAQEEAVITEFSLPQTYLYEPGPALQKSGAFQSICAQFDLKKLHKHTHLYTSTQRIEGFAGRSFECIGQYGANGKGLTLDKANLSVRNFPLNAPKLKAKLKLKDGGEDYLFACTLMDEQKTLLHCKKI